MNPIESCQNQSVRISFACRKLELKTLKLGWQGGWCKISLDKRLQYQLICKNKEYRIKAKRQVRISLEYVARRSALDFLKAKESKDINITIHARIKIGKNH